MKKFIAIFLAAFLCAADVAGQRPRAAERCFSSEAVEECIAQTTPLLTRPRLAQMFAQCLPNTLDTTVPLWGEDDTFVITGDIAALWLRDSSAQVWPYLRFLSHDARLRQLVCGLLRRQFRSLLIDPYANAFCQDTAAMSPSWSTDETEMRRGVFERKYELNSLCYPLRLAHGYYAATADTTPFDTLWIKAVRTILHTMTEQQRYGQSSYEFMRVTDRMHDTQSNRGKGHPARPCGLIASSFRASDDATIFPFLIPDNFMAASVLRKTADIVRQVNGLTLLADSCQRLAATVEEALKRHAIVKTPKHGTIYAFEVDGYGNHLLMDDANIPSLLSLPYIADVPLSDTIYQNTRRYVLSSDNPYYFGGQAGCGIGGPHVGMDYVWPMSIIMQAMTSTDEAEIDQCLEQLLTTDAETHFMHEAFHKDDAARFTRPWFAWANTLFGELILHLIDQGKLAPLQRQPAP